MKALNQHYSRIAALLALIGILSLYFLPLWRITLEAPQYPGGINMYIWINKITGDSPSTLQNINILNHYVGMKFIEPDSIPELKYFSYIIAFLALFGLFAIWKNKRKIYLVWLIVFVLLAVLGLYDFYIWEYDYGHNLSPTAPIKVPGMAYQPPLIGEKMLLNFKASSWPAAGGIFMGCALFLIFIAFVSTKKRNLQHETHSI